MPPLHKRRLGDLWVVGRELPLDDESGEMVEPTPGAEKEWVPNPPLTVWIQKLNPVDQADASRKADASRARYLITKGKPESDEYQQQMVAVLGIGPDKQKLANFLLGAERETLKVSCSARVSSEDPWSKDSYLQGLFDLWNEKMQARWLADNADPEAAEVYAELVRFNAEVDEAIEEGLAPQRDVLEEEPLEDLQRKMVERLIEIDGNQMWLDEYRAHQIFLGTFEVDAEHKKGARYFSDRAEVDGLSARTIRELRNAFTSLEVETVEGKSSRAQGSSSTSSAVPDAPATEDSSGPQPVTV